MPSKAIFILTAFILLLSACKKDASNLKTGQSTPPVQLDDSINVYPANYLKVGNYWIYKTMVGDDSTWTIDSVYIDHFKVTPSGDTFYSYSALYPYQKQYVKLDNYGILRNESGEVVFDYTNLPIATDTIHRGGGCNCSWGPYTWADSIVHVNVGGHEYAAGIYQYENSCEYGPSGWAGKKYYLTKGIGIVRYTSSFIDEARWCIPTQQLDIQLIRFHIQQ